jgi:hypothetical protein
MGERICLCEQAIYTPMLDAGMVTHCLLYCNGGVMEPF